MIIAHDPPTVRGGASNPLYLPQGVPRHGHRAGEPTAHHQHRRVWRRDLPTQAEIFVPGGQLFHDLTQHSAAGLPTLALVFGNSTAGGAYVPGMCDYVVMVRNRSKVFLGGGPPLVKMATGEVSDDESLGGARCTPAPRGGWPITWPRTSRMRSASAVASWRGSTGGRTAPPDPPRRRTRRCTTPISCSASRRLIRRCPSTPPATSSPEWSTARPSTSSNLSTARHSSPAGPRSTASRSHPRQRTGGHPVQ